ncbi:fam-a protein, partial [Plasmodium ovale curtisi]
MFIFINGSAEEIYEQNKDLLCENPEETKQAIELMNEAVINLAYHATSKDGYKLRGRCHSRPAHLYKKKHEDNTNVEKVHYPIYYSDKGNEIANNMWDPNVIKSLDYFSTTSTTPNTSDSYNSEDQKS